MDTVSNHTASSRTVSNHTASNRTVSNHTVLAFSTSILFLFSLFLFKSRKKSIQFPHPVSLFNHFVKPTLDLHKVKDVDYVEDINEFYSMGDAQDPTIRRELWFAIHPDRFTNQVRNFKKRFPEIESNEANNLVHLASSMVQLTTNMDVYEYLQQFKLDNKTLHPFRLQMCTLKEIKTLFWNNSVYEYKQYIQKQMDDFESELLDEQRRLKQKDKEWQQRLDQIDLKAIESELSELDDIQLHRNIANEPWRNDMVFEECRIIRSLQDKSRQIQIHLLLQ